MIKVGVKIMPRLEVLDTQGRTVASVLRQNGSRLEGCRVGKYVVIEIADMEKSKALATVREMAESTLCNALIETYEMDVL